MRTAAMDANICGATGDETLNRGHHDLGATNLLEAFVDATEKRTWFLFEATRPADSTGH